MNNNGETVIALLGQPNSGKSTLFIFFFWMKQHVGNWPGKTVEKKEGSFKHNGKNYLVADLPGTYSLSANSDEEMITRDYIASGKADVICILADSSQLERSLYMLADYAGITVPCFLVLNMSDVAREQGKTVNASKLEEKLGIPVVSFTATDTRSYDEFYKALEYALGQETEILADDLEKKYSGLDAYDTIRSAIPDNVIPGYSKMWLAAKAVEGDAPVIDRIRDAASADNVKTLDDALSKVNKGVVATGECKFAWIDELLSDAATNRQSKVSLGKFDRLITHHIWGKPVVILIVILGLIASFIPALPLMGIGQLIGNIPDPLNETLLAAGCPAFIAAILCDVILRSVAFIVQMLGFVFGVTLVFGLLEEIGVMARISYVFDNTMARFGLQGKSVMPFLISFGCTMGGDTDALNAVFRRMDAGDHSGDTARHDPSYVDNRKGFRTLTGQVRRQIRYDHGTAPLS